jgi:hypothetical protein
MGNMSEITAKKKKRKRQTRGSRSGGSFDGLVTIK